MKKPFLLFLLLTFLSSLSSANPEKSALDWWEKFLANKPAPCATFTDMTPSLKPRCDCSKKVVKLPQMLRIGGTALIESETKANRKYVTFTLLNSLLVTLTPDRSTCSEILIHGTKVITPSKKSLPPPRKRSARPTRPKKSFYEGKKIEKTVHLSIKKSFLSNQLSDLPRAFQQVRAVPNIIPGSGGQVAGFRILEIKENSVFTKLGLKKQDILFSANDKMINSPAQAMTMYNAINSAEIFSLGIDRNGMLIRFNYKIESDK